MSLDNLPLKLLQQFINFLFNLSYSLWGGNNSWPLVAHTHTLVFQSAQVYIYILCDNKRWSLDAGRRSGEWSLVLPARVEGINSCQPVVIVWMRDCQTTLAGFQMNTWIFPLNCLCTSSNIQHNCREKLNLSFILVRNSISLCKTNIGQISDK
jgi:hypothetical protein